jgi:hypothetical protein
MPQTRSKHHPIALALTWDGARWPAQGLPPKARAFLKSGEKGSSPPSTEKMAKLFEEDRVDEMRICWIPRLKGGNDVLSKPFLPPAGLKLAFKSSKSYRFGDILGVVYRRRSKARPSGNRRAHAAPDPPPPRQPRRG